MEKLTITVKEMSQMLGISLPKAYDLTHIEGFPVIHVGTKKIIPVDQFKQWVNTAAVHAGR